MLLIVFLDSINEGSFGMERFCRSHGISVYNPGSKGTNSFSIPFDSFQKRAYFKIAGGIEKGHRLLQQRRERAFRAEGEAAETFSSD